MKKIIAIMLVFAALFALASCAATKKDEDKSDKVKHYEQGTHSLTETQTLPEILSKVVNSNPQLFAGTKAETTTKAESTTHPLLTKTQTQPTTTQAPVTAAPTTAKPVESTETDIRQVYKNYVESNPSRYAVNNNKTSDYEPIYTYLDLDGDGTLEMIYFKYFPDFNNASLYFFDSDDGEVFEITGSDYVGRYRTTDQYRVINYNGKNYITRTNRDGRNWRMCTVYTYNGSELVPVYTISGFYNDPSYFYVSDKGDDIFDHGDSDGDYYTEVTEEEFAAIEEQINSFGTVIFYSSELFENR